MAHQIAQEIKLMFKVPARRSGMQTAQNLKEIT